MTTNSVARHFGVTIVAPMQGALAKLASTSTERASQRAAAEVTAGLIRGSKQWPPEHFGVLLSALQPLLTAAFENVTPDSLRDWESSLCDALVR